MQQSRLSLLASISQKRHTTFARSMEIIDVGPSRQVKLMSDELVEKSIGPCDVGEWFSERYLVSADACINGGVDDMTCTALSNASRWQDRIPARCRRL